MSQDLNGEMYLDKSFIDKGDGVHGWGDSQPLDTQDRTEQDRKEFIYAKAGWYKLLILIKK